MNRAWRCGILTPLAFVALAVPSCSSEAPPPTGTDRGDPGSKPRFASTEELLEWALPAVVVVDCRFSDGVAGSISQGSGFFIEPNRLVTNHHVVYSEQAKRFCSYAQVRTHDGTVLEVEGVVALDGVHDLAILEVSDALGSERRVLPIRKETPRIGEEVFALGAPRGLEFSVSQGVVSSHRKADEDDPIDDVDVFQTDAAISPGSSGGPLISRQGEVIGVVYATLRGPSQNLNFVQYAWRIAELSRGSLQAFDTLNEEAGTVANADIVPTAQGRRPPETPTVNSSGWKGWVERFGVERIPRWEIDLGAGVTMEFGYVGPGTFRMGSVDLDAPSRERPARPVEIEEGFWLGISEVTREQYWRVMGIEPGGRSEDLDLPIADVSWSEAVEFCDRLSLLTGASATLPSEAEWEYACRSGSRDRYSFGDDPRDLADFAWFVGNSEGGLRPVGISRSNAWGFHDMHGNVWEWCLDPWHEDYRNAPEDARAWTTLGDGERRVLRGGGWDSLPPLLRSASRMPAEATSRGPSDGFRVRLAR